MLKESFEIIMENYSSFQGTGMYLALFFIAMLYIFMKEENKNIKRLLVYFPILILLVTLNPIFNKIVGKIFTRTVYWRVFWMIPLDLTIIYALIKFVKTRDEKKEKIIVAISLMLILIMSGSFVYNKENFLKVGNLYKLPDEHVRIAQLIGADNTEYKKAIVPEDMVGKIRQIDSSILLSYRRNPEGYTDEPIVQHLYAGEVALVVDDAIKQNCNYVVYRKATVLKEPMENYGFVKFGETENYAIYKLAE